MNSEMSSIDEDYIYAMKIKTISKTEPNYNKMLLNEIHVNTEKKLFYIKTKNGFECFDMPKRCIVKSYKN
jgi:hypothetical protein